MMSSFPESDYLEPFWKRHRGVFKLQVIRPLKGKKGFHSSELLGGEIEGPDVEEEALALLTDPRDNIEGIGVWSVREEQFVHGYPTKEKY